MKELGVLPIVLLIHAAATWYMVGLIWFVQIVHYPLFERVGRDVFARYEAAHTRRTSWVVGPPMVIELTTALYLAAASSADALSAWLRYGGLLVVMLIWLSTALLQVPQHRRLGDGFDGGVHGKLVATNWLRTSLWSLRGFVAAAMLLQA